MMFFKEKEIPYGSNHLAGRYINVQDIQMYYEVYGEGEPLILLHGNANSIECFRHQIPQFSKHFTVFAIDSRACGRTTDSDRPLSYKQMAADVVDFMHKLHLNHVNIVGWSDGGNVGLYVSLMQPNKVRRLVTLGANFVPDDRAIYKRVLDAVKYTEYDHLSNENKAWRTRLSPNPERDRIIFEKNRHMLLHEPHFSKHELHHITVPTMVMAGDHDVIHHRHTVELFESLPNAQMCIIPGASHTVLYEKPELFNSLILDFLFTPYQKTKRFNDE